MAIDPTTTTTIKVGELQSADFNTTNLIPHEVGGYLKKGNLLDLAHFVKDIIDAEGAIGFRAVEISDGETLPATDQEEFILVGPGTFPNVGGGATVTTTEPLNALVSNGIYWFIGVEIPITASGVWGTITGVLSDQTDLDDVLEAKADLVDGKVPNSQLPSYVDDVVEVTSFEALPVVGEAGKIYVTLNKGNIYRWSGSIYIRIANEAAAWGTITGTLSDQTDLRDALDLKALKATTISTSSPLSGGGDLSANRTLSISQANTSTNGFLSSTDWNTFNNKVPYTGATANVDLGTHTLSSYNLVVNHASGSGVAAQITKGGNGEALTVVKSSGTGNAASITGGITLISELNLTTKLADAHINSAATWNAKIGGSGTTNFLPKFTGASALGNSQIFDNGTNVGIGITSPSAKLEVSGGAAQFNGGGIDGTLGDAILFGNTTYPTIYKNRIRSSISGVAAANLLVLESGNGTIGSYNNNQLVLRGDGNVGIGTTSPQNKLDVRGGIEYHGGLIYSDNRAFGWANYINNTSGFYSIFNGGDRFVVTTSGNVGIGTTSPAQKLDVNGLINSTNGISVGGSGVSVVWTGTQAAYDAIATKSSTTIYFIQ